MDELNNNPHTLTAKPEAKFYLEYQADTGHVYLVNNTNALLKTVSIDVGANPTSDVLAEDDDIVIRSSSPRFGKHITDKSVSPSCNRCYVQVKSQEKVLADVLTKTDKLRDYRIFIELYNDYTDKLNTDEETSFEFSLHLCQPYQNSYVLLQKTGKVADGVTLYSRLAKRYRRVENNKEVLADRKALFDRVIQKSSVIDANIWLAINDVFYCYDSYINSYSLGLYDELLGYAGNLLKKLKAQNKLIIDAGNDANDNNHSVNLTLTDTQLIEQIVTDAFEFGFGERDALNILQPEYAQVILEKLQHIANNPTPFMTGYHQPFYVTETLFEVAYEDMTDTSDTQKPNMVVFFHGYESSPATDKYRCIEGNKVCLKVDYQANFKQAFEHYDALINQYVDTLADTHQLIIVGHSLGGWFANHFAHKYNVPALLIAPCINPDEILLERIPCVADMDLPFLTNNSQPVTVMIEVADKNLPVTIAKQKLVDLPYGWHVNYLLDGSHRICRDALINEYIAGFSMTKLE